MLDRGHSKHRGLKSLTVSGLEVFGKEITMDSFHCKGK